MPDAIAIYSPAAALDARQAYEWYEARSLGLGSDFLRALRAFIEGLFRQPNRYPVAIGKIRSGPLRRFPYRVFYEPHAYGIEVLMIFHTSQDSARWKRRLRQRQP